MEDKSDNSISADITAVRRYEPPSVSVFCGRFVVATVVANGAAVSTLPCMVKCGPVTTHRKEFYDELCERMDGWTDDNLGGARCIGGARCRD